MKIRKTTIVLIIGLFIFLSSLYIAIGYAHKMANRAYKMAQKVGKPLIESVSYTHLTLPTICSV